MVALCRFQRVKMAFFEGSALIQTIRFDSFRDRLLDTTETLVFPVETNDILHLPPTQEKIFRKQLKEGFAAVIYRPAGRISRQLRCFHSFNNLLSLIRSHWTDLKEENWKLMDAHSEALHAFDHVGKDRVYIIIPVSLLQPGSTEARILVELQEQIDGPFLHRVDAFQWPISCETIRLWRHHQTERECLSQEYKCQIWHNGVEVHLDSHLETKNGLGTSQI